jgi:hypothetical protein
MQFIEQSLLGVRSARLGFESRTSPAHITLFPMVHVGEPEFYRLTYEDALAHDVVLFEGVRSPIATRITRSYRWLVGSRAMAGLVVQPRMDANGARAKVVHADLTAEDFAAEWKAVPLWQRALIYIFAPLVGLRRRWFETRNGLAKQMRCEDQPTVRELLGMGPETGALTQAILHARDSRLLDCLRAELSVAAKHAPSIAVVYGAAHMRAVVRELTSRRNFRVTSADWRTVMSND